ncbi:FAD-dependent oxidoreductase, partial [Endomicrobium sp. AH-315-J14]|nr:FAD-dependent oxidoreductase [Endomicrobium sp. AH-315-J14]
SRDLYPQWTVALREVAGMDVGYHRCGALAVAFDPASARTLSTEVARQTKEGLPAEFLDESALRLREPCLGPEAHAGAWFERDARVDPRLLLQATRLAAERAGVEVLSGMHVVRIQMSPDGSRATGVVTESGRRFDAEKVVVTAGAWSSLVPGATLEDRAVRPVRGQIVELSTNSAPMRAVVFAPGAYLVPRSNGRVIVGSTLEYVGYERAVTASACRDLLAAAIGAVPDLSSARLSDTWCGFRAGTSDGLPFLGPAPIDGLIIATGHFRNGVLLTPITARIVASLVLGEEPPVEIDAFRVERAAAPTKGYEETEYEESS